MTTTTESFERQITELTDELSRYKAAEKHHNELLDRFDQMDFEAYSKHDWSLFRELHTHDTHVVMPDGRVVAGIDPHTLDMENLVAFMPDARVEAHPIKVAMGDWTAVTGITVGTFTQPMTLPDGTQIPPTGKSLRLAMATFARWENGKIAEEILFWDSAEFMKQLGLA